MQLRGPRIRLVIFALAGNTAAVVSKHGGVFIFLIVCCFRCSDDRQALIWDITVKARPIEDPILAFSAGGEINQLQVWKLIICHLFFVLFSAST